MSDDDESPVGSSRTDRRNKPPAMLWVVLFLDQGLLTALLEFWDEAAPVRFGLLAFVFLLVHALPWFVFPKWRPWLPGPLVYAFCYSPALLPGLFFKLIAEKFSTSLIAQMVFVAITAAVGTFFYYQVLSTSQRQDHESTTSSKSD